MPQPYIGEIRMFAGNFAPRDWLFCEGQLLDISEYDLLYTLIGTTYGGDGQSNFALPDLRGRLPIHQGNGFTLAETGGVEEVTLTINQIPAHSHPLLVSRNTAGDVSPQNRVPGQVGAAQIYIEDTPSSALQATAIGNTGGSQPHSNFQPYLCVNFIISPYGFFPSAT